MYAVAVRCVPHVDVTASVIATNDSAIVLNVPTKRARMSETVIVDSVIVR